VNIPVGVAVYALSLRLLPEAPGHAAGGRIDVAGAVTVTASLMLAVYAIVNGNEEGWTSAQTLGLLGGAAVLLALFVALEARIAMPLMPLGLFRIRSVLTANVVGVLMAAGLFAWFFFSALYLQEILGYTPLEVGLAYLPSMVVWGASSLMSDRLVMRFGVTAPLVGGLALMTAGLLLFARTPVDGSLPLDVLPGTIAIGLGAGIAFNPILLAAMSGVAPTEYGLASGVVNTAFMMGGALGLAVLASLAAARTDSLLASGDAEPAALNGGYHVAFLTGATFCAVAAVVGAALLRAEQPARAEEGEKAPASAAVSAD
jgi:predicted MFS family arabinose efflux permease